MIQSFCLCIVEMCSIAAFLIKCGWQKVTQKISPSDPSVCTHASIFKPSLETHFSRVWLAHTGATLEADPLYQDLLQLRVILAVDLLLNLPAHPVRWTLVCHADSLTGEMEMEEREEDSQGRMERG